MQGENGDAIVQLLTHRVGELEQWRDRMLAALDRLTESTHNLMLLERDSANDRKDARQALERCFKLADAIDGRVSGIEQALPMLKETSRWVRGGVLSVVAGTVGVGGLLVLVLRAVLEHQVHP